MLLAWSPKAINQRNFCCCSLCALIHLLFGAVSSVNKQVNRRRHRLPIIQLDFYGEAARGFNDGQQQLNPLAQHCNQVPQHSSMHQRPACLVTCVCARAFAPLLPLPRLVDWPHSQSLETPSSITTTSHGMNTMECTSTTASTQCRKVQLTVMMTRFLIKWKKRRNLIKCCHKKVVRCSTARACAAVHQYACQFMLISYN